MITPNMCLVHFWLVLWPIVRGIARKDSSAGWVGLVRSLIEGVLEVLEFLQDSLNTFCRQASALANIVGPLTPPASHSQVHQLLRTVFRIFPAACIVLVYHSSVGTSQSSFQAVKILHLCMWISVLLCLYQRTVYLLMAYFTTKVWPYAKQWDLFLYLAF